jgi:hypothetical protein
MKSLQEVNRARSIIVDRLKTPDLTDAQLSAMSGILVALVWVADGPYANTMERLLNAEPIAAGKDSSKAANELRTFLQGK